MSTLLSPPVGTVVSDHWRVPIHSKTIANATGGYTMDPPCRAIRVGVTGTLIVTYASGATDTFSPSAGEMVFGQFVALATGSTATALTVFW